MLKTGDKALDFILPDQNDGRVALKDFSGKWAVLYFYPKDNTSCLHVERRKNARK